VVIEERVGARRLPGPLTLGVSSQDCTYEVALGKERGGTPENGRNAGDTFMVAMKRRYPMRSVDRLPPSSSDRSPLMLDQDTFLTTVSVQADAFCQTLDPPPVHPGPEAVLTRSELLTLAVVSQWEHFPSERAFYRSAERHFRPYFPTFPHRTQFNRLLRRSTDLLERFALSLVDQVITSRRPMRSPIALRHRYGMSVDVAGVGWRDWRISAGVRDGAGIRASISCWRSRRMASSPVSASIPPAPTIGN